MSNYSLKLIHSNPGNLSEPFLHPFHILSTVWLLEFDAPVFLVDTHCIKDKNLERSRNWIHDAALYFLVGLWSWAVLYCCDDMYWREHVVRVLQTFCPIHLSVTKDACMMSSHFLLLHYPMPWTSSTEYSVDSVVSSCISMPFLFTNLLKSVSCWCS